MEFSVGFDVDARCAKCGAECEVPEGNATRVLHTDGVIYADVPTPCECGSTRIRVKVIVE